MVEKRELVIGKMLESLFVSELYDEFLLSYN
jgi:hypothetical protein